MTRNIGEPCMCGDPACWICGDGEAHTILVHPRGLELAGWRIELDGSDFAIYAPDGTGAMGKGADAGTYVIALAIHLDSLTSAVLARATAAEAAAADLRARVAELEREAAAGRELRAAIGFDIYGGGLTRIVPTYAVRAYDDAATTAGGAA